MNIKAFLKEMFNPEPGSPNPKKVYPSTWAYGPSYITQSCLLEAPEKTLARMKAAASKDEEINSTE